ncbi:ImmA/IrrE family metallo-endopeptidase [Clostridium neonatale]|uniref:IrrE N-terminal-like domain-containing protein n=1 Tax=Clostridium neonatale TaxID=137838 RepID=A0AAD1YE34_9CLOT|nr:ImmA/IrrE family metallo-endopeptidase [Clostridium neonatale]CAI3198832.1 conserved hypothetical protein [Clostridium neonatale]CAI3202364.1 conserved hypothetical protein [Clostridium neonatale]CAI3216575.1 conserved hypothetical protein [Clostridium neonatale]CAI3224718.1 conserved hypothetical protein [Clostridium neonatale]CAI3229337.1 conserved hypothetical protein [Clostridium neonatale]
MVYYKKRAEYYIKKYKTRDPLTIAKELGIIVEFKNLSMDSPRGMFKKILGKKFIVINLSRITSSSELKMVLAHELGHTILHCNDSAFFLHDHTLYARGRFERETNLFAADLLIDMDTLDKHSIENFSINQLASFLDIPVELLKIKFKNM